MSNETLNLIITVVIVPTLAALVPLLITFINNKTNELKQKNNNEKLNKYIDIATDAVETSVVSVYQTYVDTLKKQGTWNEETQKIAFAEAKNKAVIIMGNATRETLKTAYGDLDTWIDSKIEYYVSLNKS